MPRPPLLLLLFIAGSMVMTGLVIREEELCPEDSSRSALAVLLGDGRRLFANHFLAKADAYFHRGRYPSIFEVAEEERQNYLQQSLADSRHHSRCAGPALQLPRTDQALRERNLASSYFSQTEDHPRPTCFAT